MGEGGVDDCVCVSHLGDVVELLSQLYLFPHDEQLFCVRVFHAGVGVVLVQCFLQWVVLGQGAPERNAGGTRELQRI